MPQLFGEVDSSVLNENGFYLALSEGTSDGILELPAREAALLGHLADEVITEGLVTGAGRCLCPHGSLLPCNRVICEKSMVTFGQDKSLFFEARLDLATVKRHVRCRRTRS